MQALADDGHERTEYRGSGGLISGKWEPVDWNDDAWLEGFGTQ
jgi:hypothetical protein